MYHPLASGTHVRTGRYQMLLMNMKKPKHQSSIPKLLEASAGPSWLLKREFTPKKDVGRERTRRHAPREIQAAQQLLAQIAVRIITQKVQEADAEYRTHKSDTPIDYS